MSRDRNGYRGVALRVLEEHDLGVWSEVVLETSRGEFRGIILPRPASRDDRYLILKLANGYNVSVDAASVTGATEEGVHEPWYHIPSREVPFDPDKPRVKLFGTGGTIASRLDYRTGAVIPAFTPGELYGAVPELADLANLTTKKLFGVFSENMAKEQFVILAEAIGREIEAGVDGIVVGHGTDVMGHTAAILTFMVQDPPVPIVMVGSQRSSDRPSSDAASAMVASRHVAYARIVGGETVMVQVMWIESMG